MPKDDVAKGRIAEFTLKSVITGLLFGVMFGAANAYLGMKAGLTVSTSIPIAVLSIAVFRLFRGGTLLEANMAQTVGSASSSLASGTIFTIPALFMWDMAPPVWQVAALAALGGFLGILAMVPLRRLLIVQSDAELPYPEGRACAEVLNASQSSNAGSKWIFLGLGLGAAIKIVISGFHLSPEDLTLALDTPKGASLAIKLSPALLAVGYIVGFKAAAVMVSGGLIASLVLIPLLTRTTDAWNLALGAAGALERAKEAPMSSGDALRYLGAGAVAAAGLITILKTAPTMVRAFAAVARGFKSPAHAGESDRTDRDIPGSLIVVGLLGIAAVLTAIPGIFAGDLPLGGRLAAALAVIVFGFVFVPVSSRLVGVIGVSSNPTSSMALITLIITAAAFMALGYGGKEARAAVLTVGTVVCIAASKAGDISQDLKTGQIVKGTPALQQYGQIIAAAVACWAVAAVVVAVGHDQGFVGEGAMPAPQAKLMKTVVEAVLGENLPWDQVLSGAALAGVGALAGLPALPFALGIYLPLSTMAIIFVGGLVRRLGEKKGGPSAKVSGGAGVLCASGFVAGEGLAGVALAIAAIATGKGRDVPKVATTLEILVGVALIALSIWALFAANRVKEGAEARPIA